MAPDITIDRIIGFAILFQLETSPENHYHKLKIGLIADKHDVLLVTFK